jgi:hypothetical protein
VETFGGAPQVRISRLNDVMTRMDERSLQGRRTTGSIPGRRLTEVKQPRRKIVWGAVVTLTALVAAVPAHVEEPAGN